MFSDSSFVGLFVPMLITLFIWALYVRIKLSGEVNPEKKLIQRLRYTLWTAMGLGLYFWFLLPSTPSFSTYGLPTTVADIDDPRQLLEYLQRYNQTIVRTVEVMYWLLFCGVWFVGGSLLQALNELGAIRANIADSKEHK